MDFKSTVYVPASKKSSALTVFLSICLGVVVLYNIFSMLLNGFKVQYVGGIIIAALIVVMTIRDLKENQGRYEFSMANLSINDNVVSIRYDYGNLAVNISNIKLIEYTKEDAKCLTFTGNCKINDTVAKEYFLYIDEDDAREVLDYVENNLDVRIEYLDGGK